MNYCLPDVLSVVTPLVSTAGELLRDEFFRPGGLRMDGADAIIDLEVERYLRDEITRLYPEMGFRAEEEPELNREPHPGCDLLWLLDPHDGTKAASKGYRGASVSLALVKAGTPILGIVYAYAPQMGGGDLITWAEGLPAVQRNGQPVCRGEREVKLALVSKHADRQALSYIEALDGMGYLTSPGIAYRLARVAAGDADVAMSLSVPRDFDCAGGHALLIGAGFDLFDEQGRRIRYGDGGMEQYGFCFGGGATLCRRLAQQDWSRCRPIGPAAPQPTGLLEPHAAALEEDIDRLSRAQGAWLGQLIGDALGSQVEFLDPEGVRSRWPSGVKEIVGGGPFKTIPGQMTDDSELASALAFSLLAQGAYDGDDVALAYRDWYRSEPFDVGATIREALQEITDGSPFESAARNANPASQANGALMRSAPLGIAGVNWTEEEAIRIAGLDATITHPNKVCVDANMIFVATVRRSILRVQSPGDLYRYALDLAERLNVESAVHQALLKAETEPPADFVSQMGWVMTALQNAFYELLREDSFEVSIRRTVERGGDTDTNACIAGTLLGSVMGASRVPARWVERVLTCRPLDGLSEVHNARPALYWPVDALLVAEQLMHLGARRGTGS